MRPLARTLVMLRRYGYQVGITEHFNPHVKQRHDLFGFADAIAVHPDVRGVLAVNACHMKSARDHDHFIDLPTLKVWLEAGNYFGLYQWAMKAPHGARGEIKRWGVAVARYWLNDGVVCVANHPWHHKTHPVLTPQQTKARPLTSPAATD